MSKFEGMLPAALPSSAFAEELRKVFKRVGGLDNGHWEFPEQMGPPSVGFIYIIYDKVLNRAYLGKKAYLGAGKLNKGKDSGWRKYVTSSGLMKELLAVRPREEFEFICVEQYKTKGTLSYAETWSLCAIEAPTNVAFYNTRIEAISWPVREPISERHKTRLFQITNKVLNASPA